MRFAVRPGLPAFLSGALALVACSDPAANEVAATTNETAEPAATFSAGQDATAVARMLCTDSVRQRFGITLDRDSTGLNFFGGGDSPRSVEGQVTLSPSEPATPDYRCELAAGAVTSTVELDDQGNPVAARN